MYLARLILVLFGTACASLSLDANAVLRDLPLIGDPYSVDVTVNKNKPLAKQITSAIKQQRSQSAEYKAITSATRAARFDRDIIERWLESEGYFSHQVTSEVADTDITHSVEPGQRFTIASVKLDSPPKLDIPPISTFRVEQGHPLRAADVLETRSQIKSALQQQHCLYQINVQYTAEINRKTHEAFVTFTVEDSPQVVFGETRISGATTIDSEFLHHYLTYELGGCFKRKEIELSRLALLQSNLLSRVELSVGQPNASNQVDIDFKITERAHRTLKAGVGYDSNTGVSSTLGWQHRNLSHKGERLTTEIRFSKLLSEFTSELVKPHFQRANQTLTLSGDLAQEVVDAYTYTSGEFGASINRPLSRNWAGNVGLKLEFSRDKRDGDKSDYALMSSPISLDFNEIQNLLNPTNGWVVNIQLEPFVDLYNSKVNFVKHSVSLSTYFSARDLPGQPVLALRAAVGSIDGEPLENIPSKHRYYVGGGGSVRGYGYQTAGLLSLSDDGKMVPSGGLSFGETAAELRVRLGGNWGGVIFIDGGYAYPDQRPNFGEDFLWGYGLGIRYFTSFAPIRFDIAAPLKIRRDEQDQAIDDKVQLYISIGQAF